VNDVATRCSHTGQTVRGDVAVVRSGLEGYTPYEEVFSEMDLVKTVKYYETANSNQVFDQREKKRFGSRQGFPTGFLDGVPNITI
jgi:hypothetical protein